MPTFREASVQPQRCEVLVRLGAQKASSKGRLRTGAFCLEKHQIPRSFESLAILLTWYRDTAASVYLRLFGAMAAWRYD
jgi:hypothetical protein